MPRRPKALLSAVFVGCFAALLAVLVPQRLEALLLAPMHGGAVTADQDDAPIGGDVGRVRGRDPLLQFIHERDLLDRFERAVRGGARGIFNVVADGALPVSRLLALAGKKGLAMPARLLGSVPAAPRLGLGHGRAAAARPRAPTPRWAWGGQLVSGCRAALARPWSFWVLENENGGRR